MSEKERHPERSETYLCLQTKVLLPVREPLLCMCHSSRRPSTGTPTGKRGKTGENSVRRLCQPQWAPAVIFFSDQRHQRGGIRQSRSVACAGRRHRGRAPLRDLEPCNAADEGGCKRAPRGRFQPVYYEPAQATGRCVQKGPEVCCSRTQRRDSWASHEAVSCQEPTDQKQRRSDRSRNHDRIRSMW